MKKICFIISILVSSLTFSQGATCGAATALTVNGACSTVGFSNNDNDNGINPPSCIGAGIGESDIWYTVTGTGNNITVQISGSNRDATLAMYTSCIAGESQCTYITAATTGSIVFPTAAATTYYIQIQRQSGGGSSNQSGNICAFDPLAGGVPSNDDPCGATALVVGAPGVCNFQSETNVGASASAGVPAPGCGGYAGGDVWYSIIVPASGELEIDTDLGGISDLGMAVYSGVCGTLVLEDCNDDGPNGAMSFLSLTGQTPGATLFIRVWEFGGGTGTFEICASEPPLPVPPPNDDPCSAIALTINATCLYSPSSNAYATGSAGVPAPGCGGYSGGDVWFSIVVPPSGDISIDTQAGVLTDGGMAIYSGICGALAFIECNDDSPNASPFMPSITLTGQTPGATLFIRVWEFGNNANGSFGICATEDTPVTCLGEVTNNFCSDADILTQGGSWSDATNPAYTADQSQLNLGTFCGTMANNSWYQFTASAATETFNFTSVSNCGTGTGIQAQVYSIAYNGSGCCAGFTSVSNCYNPGNTSTGTVTAVGLTPGLSYMLMVNGNGGDACDFTVSGWNASGVLPIELTKFSGLAFQEYNLLSWTTASERENDFFIIERSMDGVNFESFGLQIKGIGNSVQEHDYSSLDLNPQPGITYYRLKQYDYDGDYTYSDIISINREVEELGIIHTYPNPFTNEIKIQFNLSETQAVSISFVNQLGKVVCSHSFNGNKGGNKLELPTLFQPGMYSMVIISSNGELNQSKKLIKN